MTQYVPEGPRQGPVYTAALDPQNLCANIQVFCIANSGVGGHTDTSVRRGNTALAAGRTGVVLYLRLLLPTKLGSRLNSPLTATRDPDKCQVPLASCRVRVHSNCLKSVTFNQPVVWWTGLQAAGMCGPHCLYSRPWPL